MRRVGHDRRLPIVVPPKVERPFNGTCETCDRGYKELARRLAVMGSGGLYVRTRGEAESQHGHFLISFYSADQRLTWEKHCEHCHAAGEAL